MTLTKQGLVIAFAVIAATTGTGAVASAQGAANGQTIRGAWRTVVTPHNCQTGQPLGSLAGLFTFNQGGTMAEYGIGPGSSPALRSPGHGVWQREPGSRQYSFAFTYYRYDLNAVFQGSVKVTAALVLGASGDEFASRSADSRAAAP